MFASVKFPSPKQSQSDEFFENLDLSIEKDKDLTPNPMKHALAGSSAISSSGRRGISILGNLGSVRNGR